MTRAEKIALLQAALAGNADPIRQYRQDLDRVNGGGTYETDPVTGDIVRVAWTRTDGTPVIESWEAFEQRAKSEGMILIPHNGREDVFGAGLSSH